MPSRMSGLFAIVSEAEAVQPLVHEAEPDVVLVSLGGRKMAHRDFALLAAALWKSSRR